MSFDLRLKNGDLALGSNGDIALVQNTEKLIQDCLKISITPVGANPLQAWYGSLINKNLVGSGLDISFIKGNISQSLQTALQALQSVQKLQMKYQNVSSSEYLAKILSVTVDLDPTDYRRLFVREKVLSNALTPITVDFSLKIY